MNAISRLLHWADRCQQRRPALALPCAVWSKFNEDQAGNLAALIAYYAFVALFPLLLVLVTVLNIVLRNDPSLHARLLNSALAQYPVIGTEIKNRLGSIPGTGLPLVFGVIFLALGARGVANAMRNAMCVLWDIPKERRPGFPWSQLWSFALVLTIGLGLIVTTTLSGVVGGVGHLISGTFVTVGTALISMGLNVGVFWLSFRIATARLVPWRELLTGAAIAAAFWQLLQVAGSYVVSHQLQRSSELYGTFGIVLGLLAWLFLQAEVTLYAAEIDVVMARRLWPRSLIADEPGEPGTAGKPGTAGPSANASQPAEPDKPVGERRAGEASREAGSSLEGQPGHEDQGGAGGQGSVPLPRGEPSTSDRSDKKAGSAR